MEIKQQIRDTLENNTAVDIDFILLEPLVEQLNELFFQHLTTIAQEIDKDREVKVGYIRGIHPEVLISNYNSGVDHTLSLINKHLKELGE